MDPNRRLRVREAMLALLLAVLQGFHLGQAAPNPSPLVGSNWGNPRRYVHLQTSTDLNNFYLEIRLDGTVRKTTARSSYSKFISLSSMQITCASARGDNGLSVSVSCRCDFTQSRDQRACCHPRRQKQPVPVYGLGGKPVQLCESSTVCSSIITLSPTGSFSIIFIIWK